jgi:hypothetical protein
MTQQGANDDCGLRDDLAAQAGELDGTSWCGVLLSEMSKRELIGVVACMRRSDERNTRHYQERLAFLLRGGNT